VQGATGGTIQVAPKGGKAGVRANVDSSISAAAEAAARSNQRGRNTVRLPGADVRLPGADVHLPGTDARIRTDLDGNVRVGDRTGVSGQAGLDANARIADRRRDAVIRAQGDSGFDARWRAFSPQDVARIRTNLNTAIGANVGNNVAANLSMRDWIQNNPRRAAYWANWGNGVRGNYFVGPNPYFGGQPFYTQNFWSGRNLIGLGLAAAGYGNAGAAVAGYPTWWGYSPWTGNRPWNYWWGVPTWNGMVGWFPNYGWTQPLYYDYGLNGNVVYQGNQVLVNGQVVGTPSEYAETAAELAAIDPAAISQTAPEDWMPLGTFSLSITQDEQNPARVAQLAVNKQGLISGTVFNRNSDNLYTVQGRVDKDTQRVAFTIGDQTDTILETGLFNLTQEQTPVLVHYGPNKTATYLLARLPMPEGEAGVEAGARTSQSTTVRLPEIAR
jgi:hypothetical protein